jgi:hypothetical protein
MTRFLILFLAVTWGCRPTVANDVKLSDTRAVVQQWIETRRAASDAKNQWATEKELITASIRMFERELDDLRQRQDSLGGQSEVVDREQRELEEEKHLLDEATRRMAELATTLEGRLRALTPQFPEPLQRRIEPLLGRFPETPGDTRMTAAERMQNVVTLLSEAERFNASISVESEIRRNAVGLEVQVETLYLGLAQGYFVGEEGRFAGVTVPTGSGWQAIERSELGPRIRKAIAMYRNQQPAAFVALPFARQ